MVNICLFAILSSCTSPPPVHLMRLRHMPIDVEVACILGQPQLHAVQLLRQLDLATCGGVGGVGGDIVCQVSRGVTGTVDAALTQSRVVLQQCRQVQHVFFPAGVEDLGKNTATSPLRFKIRTLPQAPATCQSAASIHRRGTLNMPAMPHMRLCCGAGG